MKQHDYYNVDASPPRKWNPSPGGRCTHGYYNDGPSKAVPPWVVAVPAFASPERHPGAASTIVDEHAHVSRFESCMCPGLSVSECVGASSLSPLRPPCTSSHRPITIKLGTTWAAPARTSEEQ